MSSSSSSGSGSGGLSSAQVNEYIETQIVSYPEQSGIFKEISNLFQKKLWHQLSVRLFELVGVPFFQSGPHLVRLHDNLIIKIQKKLNPLQYALFAVHTAKLADNPLSFLQSAGKAVESDPQASLLIKNEISRKYLQDGKLDEVKERLDESSTAMDQYVGILEPVVHSSYYQAAMEYHQIKGTPSQYFKNSLLYLTYTPLESIPASQQISLASQVGLAALSGHDIFQFGELHPIVKVLTGDNAYILSLLNAFNTGDIQSFKSLMAQNSNNSELQKNSSILNQKIRIMALMDIVFKRSSSDRKIEFKHIAQVCELPIDQVEWLLMKSFASKVVRGQIDQVEGHVRISWVQPRVLNISQISQLRDKLVQWSKQVQETAIYLEDNAEQLL